MKRRLAHLVPAVVLREDTGEDEADQVVALVPAVAALLVRLEAPVVMIESPSVAKSIKSRPERQVEARNHADKEKAEENKVPDDGVERKGRGAKEKDRSLV